MIYFIFICISIEIDCQVEVVSGREVSYAELQTMIARVSSSLVRQGLVWKSSCVTMFSLNSIEFVVFYLAATAAGAVVSSVSPAYTSRKLQGLKD